MMKMKLTTEMMIWIWILKSKNQLFFSHLPFVLFSFLLFSKIRQNEWIVHFLRIPRQFHEFFDSQAILQIDEFQKTKKLVKMIDLFTICDFGTIHFESLNLGSNC